MRSLLIILSLIVGSSARAASPPAFWDNNFNLTAYFQANGGVLGAGQTLSQRQANYTALQNGINYAIANNLVLTDQPGIYEFYSSTPLSIPYTAQGFRYYGSDQAAFEQFYATSPGVPCMTIGDITGTNTYYFAHIHGIQCSYGAAQTGFTGSANIEIGAMAWGDIGDLYAGAIGSGTPTNPAYRGLYFNNAGNNGVDFFSMDVSNLFIWGAQFNILDVSVNGTGSVWRNIYVAGGGGSENYPAITGNAFYANAGMNEGDWDQVNVEWLAANAEINLQNQLGMTIHHLHTEGFKATGASPVIIYSAANSLTIDQWSVVDCVFLSANMTGTASLFEEYMPNASNDSVNKLVVTANNSGEVNTAVQIFNPNNFPGDYESTFRINGWKINDSGGGNWFTGHVSVDEHMPVSSTVFPLPYAVDSYQWKPAGSTVDHGLIYNITTTTTIYGQTQNTTIEVPASITSFTLTLADTMGATGTQVPPTGSTAHVRRQSGTASGTLTVKDGGGTTLSTNTTSAADLYYQFTGSAWATVTAVN